MDRSFAIVREKPTRLDQPVSKQSAPDLDLHFAIRHSLLAPLQSQPRFDGQPADAFRSAPCPNAVGVLKTANRGNHQKPLCFLIFPFLIWKHPPSGRMNVIGRIQTLRVWLLSGCAAGTNPRAISPRHAGRRACSGCVAANVAD